MTVFGIDISQYEPNVNWEEAKNNISFCFMKASQGSWIDKEFKRLWVEARGIVPRGAYHFYDARIDPVVQAKFFISTMQGDFGELPLVVDIEGEYAFGASYPFRGWKNWTIFIDKVKELVPNKTVMIYTNVGTWNYNCPTDTYNLNKLTSNPLWVADYRDGEPPRIPTGWNSWLFHQFSENAILSYVNDYYLDDSGVVIPGSERPTSTDVNYFNGTKDDFLKFLEDSGVTPPIDEPFPGTEPEQKYISGKVIVGVLNVRTEPSVYSDIFGQLNAGDLISGYTVNGTGSDIYRWIKLETPVRFADKYCAIGDQTSDYYSNGNYTSEKKEVHVITHEGIEFIRRRINNSWWYIHLIDLSKVSVKVVGSFDYVDTSARVNNASLAHNAGGWGLHPDGSSFPNEVAIYSGTVVQDRPIDGRPFVGFKDNNVVTFGEGYRPALAGIINAFGFDRFIGRDGKYNSAITNTSRNPRTAFGTLEDGRCISILVDGRTAESVGATYRELWDVASQYGVVTLGNADGGGSTAGYNEVLGLFNVPSERRAVVNRLLYFGKKLDVPILVSGEIDIITEPEESVNMAWNCEVTKTTRVRNAPTIWANARALPSGSDELPVGYKFATDTVVIREKVAGLKPEEAGIWVLVAGTEQDGWWTAATYKGEQFVSMTEVVPPVTPPPPTSNLLLDIQYYDDGRLVVNGEVVSYKPL